MYGKKHTRGKTGNSSSENKRQGISIYIRIDRGGRKFFVLLRERGENAEVKGRNGDRVRGGGL